MPWSYVLQPEGRTPPCPQCQNVTGVVRLKPAVWVCMDCRPRRAFEAVWSEPDEVLPVSSSDLTPEARAVLGRHLAGVGKPHHQGYERGYVQALVDADCRLWFTEWKGPS